MFPKVLVDEKLAENAEIKGDRLRRELKAFNSPIIKEIRGKGLLTAVEVDNSQPGQEQLAWDLCMKFADLGLLAKPTHGNIIRLAPPLVMNDKEVGSDVC